MKEALLKLSMVAAGGALGSSLRYLATVWVHDWLGKGFPWGTLLVNTAGSLLIGYFASLLPPVDESVPVLRLLLVTGLLGGFTTFSAFSMDTLQLLHAGDLFKAGVNVTITLVSCIACVWMGYEFGKLLHGAG